MRQVTAHEGFTLVELAIVLVIIGLLAAIAIPNYMTFAVRAKESAVKENMHTVQLAVEDYAISNAGTYPGPGDEAALVNMMPSASSPINPFTQAPTNLVWNADPSAQGEISISSLPGGGYIIKGYGSDGLLPAVLQMGD
jgi:prepilin-type N-terminal cleavage/methylation domain-containing protein